MESRYTKNTKFCHACVKDKQLWYCCECGITNNVELGPRCFQCGHPYWPDTAQTSENLILESYAAEQSVPAWGVDVEVKDNKDVWTFENHSFAIADRILFCTGKHNSCSLECSEKPVKAGSSVR